jgi:aspartate/methionine/tyrosine aminotransferase
MPQDTARLLSARAQEHAKDSPRNLIWKVLSDQWDPESNRNGFVSIGVAENRLMHEELREYLARTINIETSAFTYGNGPVGTHRIRDAMARFLTKHLKPREPIQRSHLMVTNGVSHAIEHLSWAFANEGDAFLLGQPYYGSIVADIALRPGVEVIEVGFGDVDPMCVEAVQYYEQAIQVAAKRNVKVKGLMLCSPHNPLGRCYPVDALIAYLKLCAKYDIHLVSDEIYALSTWTNKEDTHPPAVPFKSVLSFDLARYIDPARVHVLWGTSKDFGANGLRVGCIVSQHNDALLRALIPVAIYSSISGISDHAVANILEDDEWTDDYIQTNQQRLSTAYSHVVAFLRKYEIEYTPGPDAAFFLWVDLGKAYLKRHPDRKDSSDITQEVMDLMLEHKVFLASGAVFGSETPGVFRIVFSHPREYMNKALQRIVTALESGVRGRLQSRL